MRTTTSRGLCSHITQKALLEEPNDLHLIAVVVHRNFPAPELVEETIRKGVAKYGDKAVWYVPERDKDTIAILERHGAEYLAVPLNPYWKYEVIEHEGLDGQVIPARSVDERAVVREREFMACDTVLVFQPTASTSRWDKRMGSHLHLIKRGPKAKPRRKSGKKPIGA